MDINTLINELISYGLKKGLLDPADTTYTVNRLLDFFHLPAYTPVETPNNRELCEILNDLLAYAIDEGLLEDTSARRDLFDTAIMGLLTPLPSVVIKRFKELYDRSPKDATDFYYDFSKATNYIRTDRIARDEKWTSETEFGMMDITINLSKPEKDPRDIAKAGQSKSSGYPACLLCLENEGFGGTLTHPARQNHRTIPLTLDGENYRLQYSPYVYYNEHCIVFNEKHIPMKIDKSTFIKLLDFIRQFPHYTVGSNADLPIVGGSILSHDHFQGGAYEFTMARAPYEKEFTLADFPNVRMGRIKWPISTIRLQSDDPAAIADVSDLILQKWRSYTDEAAFILAEEGDVRHNTITPIARKRGDVYEMDLVLRNNITTEEFPLGVYHPHPEYHHIKKENIGLIEVMGLAVLPARLKKEMADLEKAILEKADLGALETTAPHAAWANEWLGKYEEITAENLHRIVQDEIALVFSHVLENAGVFKRTDDGFAAFDRFIASLS